VIGSSLVSKIIFKKTPGQGALTLVVSEGIDWG
jgi:hypothetical protein